MSQLSTLINCPEIQVELNDMFAKQDPTLITEPLVLTEWLLSEANTSGTTQKINELTAPGGGKKRIVEVLYSPRLSEADVRNNAGNTDCVAGPTPGETTATYDVGSNYLQVSTQINPRQLQYKCEDNTRFAAKKVAQIMNQLERAIETSLFNQLALLNGRYSASYPGVVNDELIVKTRTAGGNFNLQAYTELATAARWASYPGSPIVIGGRQWFQYMNEVMSGCCAIDGINVADLASKYGAGFLTSYRADNAFGEGGAMMMAPGAAQLLEYIEYEGMSNMDLGSVRQMVVTSPITGQRFDLKINVDCNGVFNFFLRKTFKLVAMPNDVFYNDDRLRGVNFINELQINNS